MHVLKFIIRPNMTVHLAEFTNRTPGVQVDPSGVSSFITQVQDDFVSEIIF